MRLPVLDLFDGQIVDLDGIPNNFAWVSLLESRRDVEKPGSEVELRLSALGETHERLPIV
jgi:hypothetical protein